MHTSTEETTAAMQVYIIASTPVSQNISTESTHRSALNISTNIYRGEMRDLHPLHLPPSIIYDSTGILSYHLSV
jgi:hypothetical protein